ncbi:MAG: flagellar FliJ family protein [Alphaproteobacteria bacterium]|nr:flagellar FliJ family protein [Alphaproteobacteria bacterium]
MAKDTLETLIRLAGSEVDEARRGLQKVLAEEDRIRADIAALEASIEAESDLIRRQPELSGSFGLFLARAKVRRGELDTMLDDVLPRVEAARDVLAEAFANQKKYEIAKENRESAASEEARRREGIALDEIGLNAHRRRNE